MVVVQQPQLGFYPATAYCQTCKENVQTQVDYEVGGLTWLIAGVLCIFGYIFLCIRYI